MEIIWDVPIEMSDGVQLRADVFRPDGAEQHPVLLSHGPYGKGLPFQQGYPSAWDSLIAEHPEVTHGSTGRYQNWEVVDPERWVPEGYVCVRVDSRGTGASPGYLDPFSTRETLDYFECIAWVARQEWSDGNVGLSGVSYYAINQWQVAGMRPPNLRAMCVWEGAADWYRDATHHGGILSTFWANWYELQVMTVQHGQVARRIQNPNSGRMVCGEDELDEETLAKNRIDFGEEIRSHPLIDEHHNQRSADFESIDVPLLSAGNWGGQGLHLRGNVEGFARSASSQKWLEMHGLEHWTHFYTDYGVDLQKRFFGHFLKGQDTGWDTQPPVLLNIRHVDGSFVPRGEQEWPLARTNWTCLHLDLGAGSLEVRPTLDPTMAAYRPMDDVLTLFTEPFQHETELTGPSALRLWLSSKTSDADVFAVLHVIDPLGDEVTFQGAIDPHAPLAQGWLRASHRKLDPKLSAPHRPYHTHDEVEPLTNGDVVALDIEILPFSVVVPAGYKLALSIRGRDYESPAPTGSRLSNFKNELRGCGPFLHDDPRDRPAHIFDGEVTLYSGGDRASYLILPVIPTGFAHDGQ